MNIVLSNSCYLFNWEALQPTVVSSLALPVEVLLPLADSFEWSLQRRAWTKPSQVCDDFTIEVEVASGIAEKFDIMSCADIGRGFRFALIGQEGTRRSPSVIYDPVKHLPDAVHLEVGDWKPVLR